MSRLGRGTSATKERVTDLVARVLSDPAIATAVAEETAGVVDREAEWRSLRGYVRRHRGLRL